MKQEAVLTNTNCNAAINLAIRAFPQHGWERLKDDEALLPNGDAAGRSVRFRLLDNGTEQLAEIRAWEVTGHELTQVSIEWDGPDEVVRDYTSRLAPRT
jgi:hypothetical protein